MNMAFKIASCVTLLILSAATVHAQPPPTLTAEQLERVSIRPVPGKEGLYVIPGFDGSLSGGNVAVRVTGEGIIVVDNKYSYSHADITRQIASISSAPIRYVLNTHHHFDHAGSNADFMAGAQVIGHENVRLNMQRNDQAGAPPLTFAERTSVFLGEAEVQAHHLGRGHTNGDSVILFVNLKTVHSGDLFIWGERLDGSTLAPFIDYANGGSALEWTATLDALLALDFDTVIPGHGPILRKADVRVYREKFVRLVARIRALVDGGTSRDDVGAELELDDLNWPLSVPAVQAIFDEMTQG